MRDMMKRLVGWDRRWKRPGRVRGGAVSGFDVLPVARWMQEAGGS